MTGNMRTASVLKETEKKTAPGRPRKPIMGAVGGGRAAMALGVLQFLGGLASAPVYALLAVYVEKVLHQPPLYTAVLKSIPLALGGLTAPAAGALADRMGYKPAYIWGMTSTVAGCAILLTGQPALLGFLCLYSGVIGSLQTTAGQADPLGAPRP